MACVGARLSSPQTKWEATITTSCRCPTDVCGPAGRRLGKRCRGRGVPGKRAGDRPCAGARGYTSAGVAIARVLGAARRLVERHVRHLHHRDCRSRRTLDDSMSTPGIRPARCGAPGPRGVCAWAAHPSGCCLGRSSKRKLSRSRPGSSWCSCLDGVTEGLDADSDTIVSVIAAEIEKIARPTPEKRCARRSSRRRGKDPARAVSRGGRTIARWRLSAFGRRRADRMDDTPAFDALVRRGTRG